ncbi:hypothetical protein HYR99_05865 [Candidatus Poribacteria bacterium]|nr:hypothetical protein [Candidatus Poribacteria bacterium]
MKKGNEKKAKRQGKSKRFSARASLIASGQFAKQWKFFNVIGQKVSIAQKVVKYTPIEKLTDAFIFLLAGAKGLYEVNKRVRPDTMLQLALVKAREVGLVLSPYPYLMPTLHIGVRSRKKNGQWSYHLLVTNLSLEHFQQLYYLPKIWTPCPEPILWFALWVYDLRGGGCETEFKADKQGLGMTKRNKKQFCAQQMLQMLADLAHNLCIWVKTALASRRRRFAPLGILRLVRDVFTISGQVVLDAKGNIKQILLNQSDPLADDFQQGIQPFLNGITVNLGKI